MKPEAFSALQMLMAFILLLFTIIIGAITLNYLKKKPTEDQDKVLDQQKVELQKTPEVKIPIHIVQEPAVETKKAVQTESVAQKSEATISSQADISTSATSESTLEATPVPALVMVPEEKSKSLVDAMSGTRKNLWGRIQSLFGGGTVANIDEIEEILYTSDLGPQTVQRLLTQINESLSRSEKKDSESVRTALKQEMLSIFSQVFTPEELQIADQSEDPFVRFQFKNPSVWLVVGVNGAGKTTSIGKMAARLAQDGKKVLVAAGDTFRAAAGSQLQVWTERAQVEIFSPPGVTDPAAVAFDAVNSGKAKGYDVVIVDTAGRLHTQQNLMEEIKKMKRVVQKVIPEAPHEVLLVLDANQGQNALMQAKEFHKALELTGVILTKMDGTAKGGVAIGVTNELQVPIKMIGVGEKINDLKPFSPKAFVESIL